MSQSESQNGMGDESQDTQVPNSAPQDDSQLDSQKEQEEEHHDKEEGEGDGEAEEVIEGKGKKSKGNKGDKKQLKTKKTAAASKKAAGKKKAEKKKEEVEIVTVRDPIARVPLPSDGSGKGKSCSFTVLSWNVNGLRATVKNGLEVLRRMVETERPDLVCFQVRIR